MNEACEAAKSIAGANANAALLVLYPVSHTSCEKKVCVEYRRQIEDKLFQSLVLNLNSDSLTSL